MVIGICSIIFDLFLCGRGYEMQRHHCSVNSLDEESHKDVWWSKSPCTNLSRISVNLPLLSLHQYYVKTMLGLRFVFCVDYILNMVYCVTNVSDFSMFGFILICGIFKSHLFCFKFSLIWKTKCKDSSPPKYTKTTTN